MSDDLGCRVKGEAQRLVVGRAVQILQQRRQPRDWIIGVGGLLPKFQVAKASLPVAEH